MHVCHFEDGFRYIFKSHKAPFWSLWPVIYWSRGISDQKSCEIISSQVHFKYFHIYSFISDKIWHHKVQSTSLWNCPTLRVTENSLCVHYLLTLKRRVPYIYGVAKCVETRFSRDPICVGCIWGLKTFKFTPNCMMYGETGMIWLI